MLFKNYQVWSLVQLFTFLPESLYPASHSKLHLVPICCKNSHIFDVSHSNIDQHLLQLTKKTNGSAKRPSQSTAGLQFYKFFFSCFTAYKNKIFSSLVKSSFTSFYSVALLHTKIRYFLRWSSPVLQDFIQLLYCIQKQDIFFVGQVQSC